MVVVGERLVINRESNKKSKERAKTRRQSSEVNRKTHRKEETKKETTRESKGEICEQLLIEDDLLEKEVNRKCLEEKEALSVKIIVR